MAGSLSTSATLESVSDPKRQRDRNEDRQSGRVVESAGPGGPHRPVATGPLDADRYLARGRARVPMKVLEQVHGTEYDDEGHNERRQLSAAGREDGLKRVGRTSRHLPG